MHGPQSKNPCPSYSPSLVHCGAHGTFLLCGAGMVQSRVYHTGSVAWWGERVRAGPGGWDPKPRRQEGVDGVTPVVCQTVGGRWHVEGQSQMFLAGPFTMFRDARLPFRY